MNPKFDGFHCIESQLQEVRAYLLSLAPTDSAFVSRLATYFLRSEGQLLRPSLVLTCARLGPAPAGDRPVALGTLVELIHAASLLHDDVIDQGRFRRRVQTINARWGNKEAVLLGDFVLARALGILARHPDARILASAERITYSLSVGELVELEHVSDTALDEESYLNIISLKTADFFRECCYLGGVAAETIPDNLTALSRMGHSVGMAYQILDDLLDVVGSQDSLGKGTIIDCMNGNLTLPLIYSMDGTGNGHAASIRQAFENRDHGFFEDRLGEIVLESGAYDRCVQRARAYVDRALEAGSVLEGPGAGEVTAVMERFASYVFRRLEAHAASPMVADAARPALGQGTNR